MLDHISRVLVAALIGLAAAFGLNGTVETRTAQAAAALRSSGGSVYASGWTQLVDGFGGRCIDVKAQDGFRAPGARTQAWPCTNVPEQRWAAALVRGTTAHYTFTALRSGFCLDVRQASRQAGASVQQWPCNRTAGQQWLALGDGSLVSVLSAQCLTALGGPGRGSMIVQEPCDGRPAQRWRSVS